MKNIHVRATRVVETGDGHIEPILNYPEGK